MSRDPKNTSYFHDRPLMPRLEKLQHLLSERLEQRAPLKLFNMIKCRETYGGFQGPSIKAPLCRKTPVSRTTVRMILAVLPVCRPWRTMEAPLRHINCGSLTLESADMTYFAVFLQTIQGSNPAHCFCYLNTEGRLHRTSTSHMPKGPRFRRVFVSWPRLEPRRLPASCRPGKSPPRCCPP